MDPQNLQTASHYVNNLLLSRGLLRDGNPIEFANPSKGEGGKEATMAKIINLVHDMVLRRDRETDTLSTLSSTLSNTRSICAQQAQSVSRLENRQADMERRVSLATSQERSAKSALKVAETRNKVLREDMSRLKTTISQIRSQCANDIRKRDTELARLKRHLEGRRSRDNGPTVGITTIVPGVTKSRSASSTALAVSDMESPSYSLKEESTEFLTQLSQSLSDENDAMIGLIQGTLSTLRELQGLPAGQEAEQFNSGDSNISIKAPPSYERLATDMDETLEHLRTILTNPSFVPLEEVEVREDEIMRLREGWEKMEVRWKEAVSLLNGWRKRMLESGDTINLDDLRKGLNLDSETPMPPRAGKRHSTQSRRSLDSCDLSHQEFEKAEQLEQRLDADPISPVQKKIPGSVFPAPHILGAISGNSRPSPSSRNVVYHAHSPKVADVLGSFSDEDEIALLDSISADAREMPPSKKRKSEEIDPVMTVQEKLQAAEEEALEATRTEQLAEVKKKPVKRTAIPRKVRSKRRSTLSPEELEGLMGVA